MKRRSNNSKRKQMVKMERGATKLLEDGMTGCLRI